MTAQIWVFALGLLGLAAAAVLLARWAAAKDTDYSNPRWFAVAFIAGFLALGLVLASVILPAAVISDSISCRNSAANLELPYRYSMSAGCYVKFHGQWIGIDKALGIVTR